MDKNVVKYGAIGLGVLVAVVLLRGGGSGGGGNAQATLQSFADTNATGVKFAALTAQRDIAAIQATTDRANLVASLFNSQTANNNTIAVQTVAANANIVNAALTNAAIIEQSHIASALAITLDASQQGTSRYGIDAEKYITDSNNTLSKTLGMYAKDQAETTAKIGAVNNLVDNIAGVWGSL